MATSEPTDALNFTHSSIGPDQGRFFPQNLFFIPPTGQKTEEPHDHRHQPVEPQSQGAQPTDNAQAQELPPIDDEPLYVNAKQYVRILKRRVVRARLDEVHRLSRQRKVRYTPSELPMDTVA